ncbi:hypothetical protein DPEC_G00291790 [Dallia pectoralis]|uniref:Uncharacterized protein n=1 Tax=Dallia pectoralis TaxID=75939 RepID=A0ACC2FHR6_DALPE|nr:hypothetical protein DPEC_G00291790 [Dallia pectoralis]
MQHFTPVKEVVIVHHPASKVNCAQHRSVLSIVAVRIGAHVSIAQAGFAHATVALLLLRPREANNTDGICWGARLLVLGHYIPSVIVSSPSGKVSTGTAISPLPLVR